MQILVVGGDSFIARCYYNYACNNHQFKLISRKPTGIPNEHVLKDLFSIPDEFFQGQDVLINFAAIVHEGGKIPEIVYKRINYELPVHLANRACLLGIKQFIQMSTIAVYGDVSIIDEATPCKSENFYAKYKMLADNVLLGLENNNFTVTCIRPSIVYGGGIDAPGNMRKLISLINLGLPLPTKGIWNQRHFLNINKLNIIINHIVINTIGGAIIVADSQSYSTTELISCIYRVYCRKDRQYSFPLLWAIIKKINYRFYNKLCGNLIVKSTLDLICDDKSSCSLLSGIKEMVKKNKCKL